jgi:hypothetical protein
MRYLERITIGLGLLFGAFGILFFGSPARQGFVETNMAYVYAYVLLFAMGFIFFTVGLLGFQDYPGYLSSLVLYMIVGAVITIVRYVVFEGTFSLADGNDPNFWMMLVRRMVLWPIEIVRYTGIFGYKIGI